MFNILSVYFGVNVLDANVSAVTILEMHVKNRKIRFVLLNFRNDRFGFYSFGLFERN